jgi:hypothetical protein
MNQDQQDASRLIELAEAEYEVIKQELLVQQLLDTDEPTEDARATLQRLREIASTLSRRRPQGREAA